MEPTARAREVRPFEPSAGCGHAQNATDLNGAERFFKAISNVITTPGAGGTMLTRRGCHASGSEDTTMKLATIGLTTALAISSTAALAQAPGVGGYGTVTAPSVGSYTAPVGTTNVPRTWSNTGPSARQAARPSASAARGSQPNNGITTGSGVR